MAKQETNSPGLLTDAQCKVVVAEMFKPQTPRRGPMVLKRKGKKDLVIY